MRVLIILAVTALASGASVNRDKRSFGHYDNLPTGVQSAPIHIGGIQDGGLYSGGLQAGGLQAGGLQATSIQSNTEHSTSYQSNTRQSTVLNSVLQPSYQQYQHVPLYQQAQVAHRPVYNVQPTYSVPQQTYNVQTPVQYAYPVNRIVYREPLQTYAPVQAYPVQTHSTPVQQIQTYAPVQSAIYRPIESYRPVQTIHSEPIRTYNQAPLAYHRNNGGWNANPWC